MKVNYARFREEIVNKIETITVVLFLLIIYFGVKFLWGYFDLPNQSEIFTLFKNIFEQYGSIIVFLGAIFESTIFLGSYFPGTIIIFLAVAVSSGDPGSAIQTILLACLGIFIGHNINYLLGKYGFQKVINFLQIQTEIDSFKNKIEKRGIYTGFLFYILPGSGAIYSSTLGLLKYNYLKFASFIFVSILFWNSLWGIITYTFGVKIFEALTGWGAIFIIIFTVLFYLYMTGKLNLKADIEDAKK